MFNKPSRGLGLKRVSKPVNRTVLSLGAAIALAYASQSLADPVDLNIPAQPLSQALQELGKQANLQILYSPESVRDTRTSAVKGHLEPSEALERLLRGTGIRYQLNGNTVILNAPSSDSAAINLDNVLINSRIDSATTEGTHSYASPVTSIGKGVKNIKDIPQAVSVVTQRRMQEQDITNVTEALLASPGITAVPSFTGYQFYSRGFFINSFQYDGVPLERQLYARGSSFGGQTAILDRVEVLRGPQGLLEGGGDPSGAVNLVRKRPTFDPQVNLTAKAGSWDRYGAQVDVAGPLDEQRKLRGRVVMDYDTANSFVNYVGSDNQTLYAALDYDLTPDTTIGVGYSHERVDATPNFMGIPNFTNGSMPSLDRSTYLGTTWDNWDKTQDTYYLDITHQLNDTWKLKGTFINAREFNDFKYLQRRGRMGPGSTLVGDAYVFDYFSDHWGGDINATGDLELFERKLGLTVGTNYSKLKSHDVWGARYNYVRPINIFDYVPNDVEPSDDSIYSANKWDDAYDSTQKGIYGVANYELTESLSFILGARVSDFRTVFTSDGPWGASKSEAQKNGKVTPYTGLVYKLDPNWSAYASYTEIFKPQTQRSAAGNILDPRTGKSYEVGLKGEHKDGRLITSFSLYQMEQDNIPMPDSSVSSIIANANCSGTCYIPSGTIQSRGFEAEVSGEVLDGLQLYAGYTLNLLKYKDEEPAVAGNISANTQTPKHILRTWANYQLPGNWSNVSIGGGVNTQSSASGFGYYGRNQGGYSIWNGRIAYQIDKNFSASVNINNIFDKKYYQAIDYDHNFYGDPRNTLLTLKYSY
ncbi:TonB-dependent siderophore receptor [Pseudomonas putida]|uniref:TonB-dependent siderophore receptor n=1 Tax=Pseudomonas putida TaxID=303 RepID=UPI0023660ECB|nr:TonB-dependent siderophore receptor [Pseudomonas putida]MDD2046315.1 TonB-dependent siderophore receptor [Pseudomonas putida]